MSKVADFIDNFLAHYTSEYYDPAKAHEYYLKNRDLKGRRAVSGLKSDKQKQAWAYAKDKITTERKELLKETGAEFRGDIKIIRDEASGRRKQLSEKLSMLLKKATEIRQKDAETISKRLKAKTERIAKQAAKEAERLSEQHHSELQRISDEATSKIASLPPIPKGISSERRAELAAKRSEEIAKIRGTATKDRNSLTSAVKQKRKDISDQAHTETDALQEEAGKQRENLAEWSKADKTKHRERVGSEREDVATNLKATVDRGREGYEKSKENIKAKYEAKLDQEYEAIKNNV